MSATLTPMIWTVFLKEDENEAYSYDCISKFQFNRESGAQTTVSTLTQLAAIAKGPVSGIFMLHEPIDLASIRPEDYRAKFDLVQRHDLVSTAFSVSPNVTFEQLGITEPEPGSKKVLFVVLFQSPVSGSRSLGTVAEERNVDRATALQAIREEDAPSNGARHSHMRRTQVPAAPDVLYNNRPLGLSPRPVAIYSQILATLRNDLLIVPDRSTFSPDELERAYNVIEKSLDFYPDEAARLDELNQCFNLSGQPWSVRELRYSETREPIRLGGCFRLWNAEGVHVYPSIHAGKNDEGEGRCSAIAQAQKSYQKIVASDDYTSVRAVSCCPSVLLGLQGPNLTVSGAVFTDRFFVQQFGVLHLGPQLAKEGRSGLEEGILETAKYLRALDRAVSALGNYYMNLSSPPAPSQRGSMLIKAHHLNRYNRKSNTPVLRNELLSLAHFPYRDSFAAKGAQHHLTYTRHLTPRDIYKTLFAATMESDLNKTDVVVKFAYSYSPAAHELLAENGLAPKLFYHEFDKDMQMWMIVMEHVEGHSWPAAPSRAAKDSLEKAVKILHDAGYVLGDLRAPNILTKGDKIKIIDFDWCGMAEESRYPVDMNTSIGWHAQAKPGSLMKKEHDLYCLDILLDRN